MAVALVALRRGPGTLVNLVPRFPDVITGSVRIDGRDARPASLRSKIGIVAQDTFLFNDTAANNISVLCGPRR
ncbi:MAG: hypothetical protein U0Q18_29675 [Bryobacteraceae bacterium]